MRHRCTATLTANHSPLGFKDRRFSNSYQLNPGRNDASSHNSYLRLRRSHGKFGANPTVVRRFPTRSFTSAAYGISENRHINAECQEIASMSTKLVDLLIFIFSRVWTQTGRGHKTDVAFYVLSTKFSSEWSLGGCSAVFQMRLHNRMQ
jgi:hypothetical protein